MVKIALVVLAVVVAVALVIMTIALLATSLKKLSSKEMGLQYDVVQKDLSDEVFTEGLHTGPPGYEFIVFPNIFKNMHFDDIDCMNKDGLIVTIQLSYQYRVQMSKLREVVTLFRDFDGYNDLLVREGLAAFHETCSLFTTTQFQAERGVFESELERIITARYEIVYCDVAGIQVNNIDRPKDYEEAVKSKESAKEDIKVAEQERPRLETHARTEKELAVIEAAIIVAKAESEARIVNATSTRRSDAIQAQYEKETEAYEFLVRKAGGGMGLSPQGLVAYLGVRVVSESESKRPRYVGLASPAKTFHSK